MDLPSTIETYLLDLEPKSWLRLTLASSFGTADICVTKAAGIKNIQNIVDAFKMTFIAFGDFIG